MAAILTAAGAGASGQQAAGIVQQYQIAATSSAVDTSTGVTPRDSGTIVIQTSPGKTPEKQTQGYVQRRSQIVADGTAGAVGNALTSTYSVGGGIPQAPAGSLQSDGLSQNQSHE
jgi:hypothetical protein